MCSYHLPPGRGGRVLKYEIGIYVPHRVSKWGGGGLGSGPTLKMGASGRAATRGEKQGILELKITKKRNFFFNTLIFSICRGRKSGTKNCICLKKGSFGAPPPGSYLPTLHGHSQ